MAEVKRSYLVAYDIIDDRRRSHVSKILSTCGERLQYSVFFIGSQAVQDSGGATTDRG